MPPPLQSDAFIRRMCPQNHPPALTKVYNIAPTKMNYMNVLPGIKPAAPQITSPLIINTMAKSIIKDNTQNAKALLMAQEGVLKIYEQPAKNIEKLMTPSGNLRGTTSREVDVQGRVLNLAQ